MKKSVKKSDNKKLNTPSLYLFFILIASIIMCVGYASINVPLGVTGHLFAEVQEKVFIIDAVCTTDNCNNSKVNYYYQTLLDSNINLGTDENSKVTYQITLYNNSDIEYVYKETLVGDDFYSNSNIAFDASLKVGDIIASNGGRLTFDITFSYVDGKNITDTILESYLNFIFVPRNEVSIVTLVHNDVNIKKILDDGVTSIEFNEYTVQSGVVVGCNQDAVPSYVNNLVSATNVTDNTVCTISDSLKVSVETVDTTKNHLLMIDKDATTLQISQSSDQNINLDINGKTITSTLPSLSSFFVNNGYLEIFDSTNNGVIQTNHTLLENKGELVIHSGKFIRKNSSTQKEGKVIVNNGGNLNIDGGTYISDGDNTILTTGAAISTIKDSQITITGTLGNAITNATSNGIVSVQNSTISSKSGAVTSMNNPRGTYISKCKITAPNADLASDKGSIHYTADTIFNSGTNVPTVVNQSTLGYLYVKNFIKNAADDWYYLKNTSGSRVKSTDGKDMMVGEAFYIRAYSNHVIDIYAGDLVSKSNVQIYTLNNTNAQQFMFLASSSSGYYNIAPFYAPKLFFNIDGGTSASLAHGANIHIYSAGDKPHERFKFDYSNNNGYYELKSYYGTNIDVYGGSSNATNGTNVWSYNDNSSTGQFWKFVRK